MLASRIATGFVVVPILLVLASDRGWLFLSGVFAATLLGTAEALWMARQAGHRPLAPFAYLMAIALLFDAAVASPSGIGQNLGWSAPWRIVGPALGLLVLTSLTALLVRVDLQDSLVDWALTLALPLYVAGLSQFFIPLRERPEASSVLLSWPVTVVVTWPVIVMTTSWACDSAAYFVGRAVGKTRLAPQISPAKSREGALAGIAMATLVGSAFAVVTGIDHLRMAGFGLAVGLGSVLGDLVESLIKRQCGVKDSGFIMPGHGGILDRMDALIFSSACAYFYLQAVL